MVLSSKLKPKTLGREPHTLNPHQILNPESILLLFRAALRGLSEYPLAFGKP